MKTHTHTRLTFTIPGTEIEVELPIEPDCVMEYREPLVKITDDAIILGYLAHDDDCENPLKNDDYMGRIYECRRHGDTLRDYEKALGLANGGPDLELVDESKVVKTAIERILADKGAMSLALEHCSDHWPRLSEEEADATFIVRCLDTVDELAPVIDIDSIRINLWRAGRKNGTIGAKYAVLLDVYEHGGIAYSVSGQGMQCDFDTARGGAVWVPSEERRKELDVLTPGLAQVRAQELAKLAAKTYTDWCNGNCFGVVVVTYDKGAWTDGQTLGEILNEDAVWGFIGADYAYESLKNDYFPKEG